MMTIIMILIALAYGMSMKVADLLNEHGFKWFKHADIVFGFVWGLLGAVLIFLNGTVANILLAMVIAFIIRERIDYFNHAIATTIILISFFVFGTFDLWIFSLFFLTFAIFGGLKDYMDDVKKAKGWLFKLTESKWYYPVPTLIYGLVSNDWIPFMVFTAYTVSYDFTKVWVSA